MKSLYEMFTKCIIEDTEMGNIKRWEQRYVPTNRPKTHNEHQQNYSHYGLMKVHQIIMIYNTQQPSKPVFITKPLNKSATTHVHIEQSEFVIYLILIPK